MTVVWNGSVVQEDVEVPGPTRLGDPRRRARADPAAGPLEQGAVPEHLDPAARAGGRRRGHRWRDGRRDRWCSRRRPLNAPLPRAAPGRIGWVFPRPEAAGPGL
jgi:hypothetical protein